MRLLIYQVLWILCNFFGYSKDSLCWNSQTEDHRVTAGLENYPFCFFSYSEDSFRWNGRTEDHCLASGLDDYPRASIVTTVEGHIDAHSWIIITLEVLHDIALKLNVIFLRNKFF